MNEIVHNRAFMKCPDLAGFRGKMDESDQQKGIPHPPHNKPPQADLITLPDFKALNSPVVHKFYEQLLDIRRSARRYDETTPMTQEQLAFLLWSAGGIQEEKGHATLRPTPSGGARYPFELYVAAQNVEGLKAGAYRYVPSEHIGEKTVAIEYVKPIEDYKNRITTAVARQGWAAEASAVLFASCVPYKSEWRYRQLAHRVMLIDLGHLGQNVMLSAAGMGLGSCCMAAFDQITCDAILGVDGVDEYTVYLIAVGPTR